MVSELSVDKSEFTTHADIIANKIPAELAKPYVSGKGVRAQFDSVLRLKPFIKLNWDGRLSAVRTSLYYPRNN